MRETNNPDVALAWEWIEELHNWVEENSLLGYDRFDIKEHSIIRFTQTIPPLRKITSGITEFFPVLSRKLFCIKFTENPKAYALTAAGYLRLHQIEPDQGHLEKAQYYLQWLKAHRINSVDGWSWGYPFSYTGKGLHVPANTPVSVVTAIAGQAFLLAYQLTQEEQYYEAISEIAKYFTEVLPRWEIKPEGLFFAYALEGDPRKVHNANLLVAEFLYRASIVLNDIKYREIAEPAVQLSASAQKENGAWTYGYGEENDPSEKSLYEIVDNHHTGFVLRSLYEIYKVAPSETLKERILKGFQFYTTLFSEIGQPYFSNAKKSPTDIHACAEGILCPSVLSEVIPAAHVLAVFVLRWSWYYMRDHKTGELYYRRYPFFTSKITFPRWGVAWMFRAISEYLYHFHEVKERVERLRLQTIRWIEIEN